MRRACLTLLLLCACATTRPYQAPLCKSISIVVDPQEPFSLHLAVRESVSYWNSKLMTIVFYFGDHSHLMVATTTLQQQYPVVVRDKWEKNGCVVGAFISANRTQVDQTETQSMMRQRFGEILGLRPRAPEYPYQPRPKEIKWLRKKYQKLPFPTIQIMTLPEPVAAR